MNDTLTWSDYIDMVCNKVTRSLNLLRRLSWFLPQPLLLYLKSYILPSFDYCDVVWSGCTEGEALHLEILLNFACRTVLCRRKDYSASAAHSKLGLSTLSARRKFHLAQTIFKCLSSQSPPYLFQLFSSPTSHYNTCSSSTCQLNLPSSRTCFGQKLTVLLVLPCSGLFQLTSEIVQTLEPCRDFVRPSYCEQCALLTTYYEHYFCYYSFKCVFSYMKLTNHSITYFDCVILSSPILCVGFAFVLCTCTFAFLFWVPLIVSFG